MTIRIFGGAVDEPELFVDADIERYNLDGTVTLAEVQGQRTWTLPESRVQALKTNDKLADHANIDTTHDVWTVTNNLRNLVGGNQLDHAADHIRHCAETMFQESVRAMNEN